jgi:carbamoyl-phosphate synthase small subunit
MKEPIDGRSPWLERRTRLAYLALEDGSIFRGVPFGAREDAVGEVVFNTGMSGYQEIVTDPSYAGQFVTLTVPEVGNYGCTPLDAESRGLFLNGLVVHELNPPSNHRSTLALDAYMAANGKPGIAGIDTRSLTLLLREKGSQKAFLHVADSPLPETEAVRLAREWSGLDRQDYASAVSTPQPYVWSESGSPHVAVIDFGVKHNTLRRLVACGCRVTVLPAATSAREILALRPDGVLLSNGPADPSALGYAIETVRALLGAVPIMGICLGHQLLGLACGADCGRLKFGHHGCNHPVRNLLTGTVAITSQNHNYALSALPDCLETTHLNLNDGTVEGIRHRHLPAFGVQFHPEAAPGPRDAAGLFDDFITLMGHRQ